MSDLDLNALEIYRDKTKIKLNPTKEQVKALKLFLNYKSITCIAKELELSRSTVNDWCYDGRNGLKPFRHIRGQLEKEQIKNIVSHRAPSLNNIAGSCLDILENSLKKLSESRSPMEIDQLKKVSDIISNMDRIMRLDNGEATDNVAVANIDAPKTMAEVKKIMKEVDTFGLFSEGDDA